MKCNYCSTVNQYHKKDCPGSVKKLPDSINLSQQDIDLIDEILDNPGEEIVISPDDPLLQIPRFKKMWDDSFH